MKRIIFVALTGAISLSTLGQDLRNSYSPNSVRPIASSDIMWKKNYTRVLDLREKQNQSWMAVGNELSKLLIEGVTSGKITAYTSDKLIKTMNINEFLTKMTIPAGEIDYDPYFDSVQYDIEPEYYFPNQLYIVELTENAIFDKKESRIKYDIQTISLYIPADLADNLKGVQEHLVTLKYIDCVKYFNELNQWVWYNRANSQEHKGFSQAFDLRLFASTIVKVSNPEDLYIEDIYGSPEAGILGAQQESFKLMEMEHHLYEY